MNKYVNFSFDGSRVFDGRLSRVFEDILMIGWNAGIPFVAGVLSITTNEWFILLFMLSAWLRVDVKINVPKNLHSHNSSFIQDLTAEYHCPHCKEAINLNQLEKWKAKGSPK